VYIFGSWLCPQTGKCVIESLGKMLRLPPATIQQMFEEFPLGVRRQRPLDPSRDGDMMDMLLGYAVLSGARGRLSLVEYIVHLTHEFRRKEWLSQNVSAVFAQFGELIAKARYKQEFRFGASHTNSL